MPVRILLFITALCYLPTVTALEGILKYDCEMTVNPDASINVVETITLKAEGIKIKHGIFRDLAKDYKDSNGHRYQIGLKVLDLLRDGNPEPYRLNKQSNSIRIYLGRKDRYLEPGIYTYVLSYKTSLQLGFFNNHDELYRNFNGNSWGLPIKEISVTINLPHSIPNNSITVKTYSGQAQQKGTDYVTYSLSEHSINFESPYPLGSDQDLAIKISWPKNLLTEPDSKTKLSYFLKETPESIPATIGIVTLSSFCLWAWFRTRKDSEGRVKTTLDQSLNSASPASMRLIQHMTYDYKTIATAMINLAIKGHLHIEEGASGKFILNKKYSSNSLAPDEKTLLNNLFAPDRQFIELKKTNHTLIKKAVGAHKKALQLNIEKIYFMQTSTYLAPTIALSIFLLILIIFTVPNGEKSAITLLFPAWLSIWIIAAISFLLAAYKSWKNFFVTLTKRHLIPCLIKTVIALPLLIVGWYGLKMLAAEEFMTVAISLPLLIMINFCFYNALKSNAFWRRRLLDKFACLRIYLDTSKKDPSINSQSSGQTQEFLEQLLPFALALDIEKQWSEKFLFILQQTNLDTGYRPRWYNSNDLQHNHVISFAQTICTKVTSAIASSLASKEADSDKKNNI